MKKIVDTGMESRKKTFNDRYLGHMLGFITPEGGTEGLEKPIGFREVLWHCFPLFEAGGEYAARANSIIRNTVFDKCHFMPMNFMQLLLKYGELIEPDVSDKLKEYVLDSLPHAAAERIHVAMYNDNFAAMAIFTLLAAGEMFGLPEYFDKGMEKLKDARDYFYRCGAIMEYGSPTYTPIDTLCYAEMANHVKDIEAREIAMNCEERMWVEIATHYHPETARLAGPYSRAYSIDMVGHPHLFAGLAWYVFGDRVFSNPVLDLFSPHERQVMHNGLENLTLPNIAWVINADYHCPEYLYEHAFGKEYPYETEHVTECLPSNVFSKVPEDMMHEYPGVRGRNYTYMTGDFAMGTAGVQYNGGAMTESFHVTYRNKEKAGRLFDTGVIYSRYLFNDRRPVKDNVYSVFGKVNYTGLREEGRTCCIQDKGVAIVAYKPKQYEKDAVTSAGVSIMIPIHFYDGFEIYAGDEPVDMFPFNSEVPLNIYIKVCNSYFAFIPLEVTDLGRSDFLRIEKADDHIMISFFNYEGQAGSFKSKELMHSQNGFICIAENNCSGMSEFMEYAGTFEMQDVVEYQLGAKTRRIRFRNEKTELRLMYSMIAEGVFVSTVNKRPTGTDILKADGLDLSKVPYL